MKYFSSYATRMFVLRKEGFYMSRQTAKRVVRKLTPVLSLGDAQQVAVINALTLGISEREVYEERGEGQRWDNPHNALTGSQIEVIQNLIQWYSIEGDAGLLLCYTVCDLNLGLSLVITAR